MWWALLTDKSAKLKIIWWVSWFEGNLPLGKNSFPSGRIDLFLYLKELWRFFYPSFESAWCKGRFVTGVFCVICGWMIWCLEDKGGWIGVIWSGKMPAKFLSWLDWSWLSEAFSKDSSDYCSASVWSRKINWECLPDFDLSSEGERCLVLGDVPQDLSQDLERLFINLGFLVADLFLLGNSSEQRSYKTSRPVAKKNKCDKGFDHHITSKLYRERCYQILICPNL